MESLDTPRLRLRPLDAADEALYCDLYSDPAVMAQVATPLSRDAARSGFRAARRRNADPAATERRWTVLDRETGAAIGLVALLRSRDDPGSAELGVMLLPAAQGRGLARELNDLVAQRSFEPGGWGLHRVWARHAAGHGAAASVLAASGFEPGPPLERDATVVLTRARWRAGRG